MKLKEFFKKYLVLIASGFCLVTSSIFLGVSFANKNINGSNENNNNNVKEEEKHECHHLCPICEKCTSSCTEPECTDKCQGHEEEKEKTVKDYSLSSFKEIFKQDGDYYGIMFIQTGCGACAAIEDTCLEYLKKVDEGKATFRFYYYNISYFYSEGLTWKRDPNVGTELGDIDKYLKSNTVTTYEDVMVNYTPTLYIIENKQATSCIEGYRNIPSFLNKFVLE